VGVRVELDADAPATLAALTGLAGIGDLDAHPVQSGAGLAIEYTTREPRRVNPVVVTRLVNAGAKVVTVTTAARPLEQIYAEAVAGPSVGEDGLAAIGSDGR
jgi:hypothetical protein